MIATIVAVLGSFAFLVLRSFRKGRADGQRYQPEGKLRWGDDEPS